MVRLDEESEEQALGVEAGRLNAEALDTAGSFRLRGGFRSEPVPHLVDQRAPHAGQFCVDT